MQAQVQTPPNEQHWATIYTDRCYGHMRRRASGPKRARRMLHVMLTEMCHHHATSHIPACSREGMLLHATCHLRAGGCPDPPATVMPGSGPPSTHGVAEEACGPKDAAAVAVDVAFERVR